MANRSVTSMANIMPPPRRRHRRPGEEGTLVSARVSERHGLCVARRARAAARTPVAPRSPQTRAVRQPRLPARPVRPDQTASEPPQPPLHERPWLRIERARDERNDLRRRGAPPGRDAGEMAAVHPALAEPGVLTQMRLERPERQSLAPAQLVEASREGTVVAKARTLPVPRGVGEPRRSQSNRWASTSVHLVKQKCTDAPSRHVTPLVGVPRHQPPPGDRPTLRRR